MVFWCCLKSSEQQKEGAQSAWALKFVSAAVTPTASISQMICCMDVFLPPPQLRRWRERQKETCTTRRTHTHLDRDTGDLACVQRRRNVVGTPRLRHVHQTPHHVVLPARHDVHLDQLPHQTLQLRNQNLQQNTKLLPTRLARQQTDRGRRTERGLLITQLHLIVRFVVGYEVLLVVRQLCHKNPLPLSHFVVIRTVRMEQVGDSFGSPFDLREARKVRAYSWYQQLFEIERFLAVLYVALPLLQARGAFWRLEYQVVGRTGWWRDSGTCSPWLDSSCPQNPVKVVTNREAGTMFSFTRPFFESKRFWKVIWYCTTEEKFETGTAVCVPCCSAKTKVKGVCDSEMSKFGGCDCGTKLASPVESAELWRQRWGFSDCFHSAHVRQQSNGRLHLKTFSMLSPSLEFSRHNHTY